MDDGIGQKEGEGELREGNEGNARWESFADFYTNKKTSQSARKTRSEEARDIDNSDVSPAKLQKVSEPIKERPTFYSNAERAVEGIRASKCGDIPQNF